MLPLYKRRLTANELDNSRNGIKKPSLLFVYFSLQFLQLLVAFSSKTIVTVKELWYTELIKIDGEKKVSF